MEKAFLQAAVRFGVYGRGSLPPHMCVTKGESVMVAGWTRLAAVCLPRVYVGVFEGGWGGYICFRGAGNGGVTWQKVHEIMAASINAAGDRF